MFPCHVSEVQLAYVQRKMYISIYTYHNLMREIHKMERNKIQLESGSIIMANFITRALLSNIFAATEQIR